MANYSSKELIKKLEKGGFKLQRIRGSHHMYKHEMSIKQAIPTEHEYIEKIEVWCRCEQFGHSMWPIKKQAKYT